MLKVLSGREKGVVEIKDLDERVRVLLSVDLLALLVVEVACVVYGGPGDRRNKL